MSIQQRKEIAYWFMLIIGAVVMAIQVFKYGKNTLEFSFGEIMVTVVSVALMIFPRFILRVAENFINSKKKVPNNVSTLEKNGTGAGTPDKAI